MEGTNSGAFHSKEKVLDTPLLLVETTGVSYWLVEDPASKSHLKNCNQQFTDCFQQASSQLTLRPEAVTTPEFSAYDIGAPRSAVRLRIWEGNEHIDVKSNIVKVDHRQLTDDAGNSSEIQGQLTS